MRFTAALFALSIALTGVNADIVAFNGDNCDGDGGLNVPCDNSCHQFDNRHSFRVLAQGKHCVSLYDNNAGGCTNKVGEIHSNGNGACSNANTGTNVQSFRCSPTDTCE